MEAGDTFLREGAAQRHTSWVKHASLVRSRQKHRKESIVREDRGRETPRPAKARLLPLRLSSAQLPSPRSFQGRRRRRRTQGVRAQNPAASPQRTLTLTPHRRKHTCLLKAPLNISGKELPRQITLVLRSLAAAHRCSCPV